MRGGATDCTGRPVRGGVRFTNAETTREDKLPDGPIVAISRRTMPADSWNTTRSRNWMGCVSLVEFCRRRNAQTPADTNHALGVFLAARQRGASTSFAFGRTVVRGPDTSAHNSAGGR